tara:strand:- start:5860 stop:6675 length:816 start_codon:yes stop_codon:yes gene_type:complete
MEKLSISQEEYFARPEISNSMMKDFRDKGPWTFYHTHIKRSIRPSSPSDAMRIGSAFHLIMADFDVFSESAVVTPVTIKGDPVNMRLKAHREWMAEFREINEGKIVLSPEEMDMVMRMKDSVYANPAAAGYATDLTVERNEVVGIKNIQGMECKAMCDADFSDRGILVDFKTTRQHLGVQFAKDAIYKYGYQFQAAHYCDVFDAERFIFIVVRNFPPYETLVFEIPEEMMGQARMINYQTLDRINWCVSQDDWHTDGWGQVINLEDMINNE